MGMMQLSYTPTSHFARKVRILAAAMNCPLALVNAGIATSADPAAFAGNPLLRVPTLIDGDTRVFDSDAICAYLVRQYDPTDRFGVLDADILRINARTVMNGIMSAEVELVIASRHGLNTDNYARLNKLKIVIESGLAWLEQRYHLFTDPPDCLGFHLVSMWDHLAYYGNLPQQSYRELQRRVKQLSEFRYITATNPENSVKEAS